MSSKIFFNKKSDRVYANSFASSILKSAVKLYGTVAEMDMLQEANYGVESGLEFPKEKLERFEWMCRTIGYDVVVR